MTTRRDPGPGTRAAAPRPRVSPRLLFGIAMLAVAQGCGPRPKQVVTNPDPAGKVPAIEHAVARRDLTVVPQLVKDLDDDDPAVRFYAIYALRELTGQEFGYRYFYDTDQRKPYVLRWNQWLSEWQAQQPAPQPSKN